MDSRTGVTLTPSTPPFIRRSSEVIKDAEGNEKSNSLLSPLDLLNVDIGSFYVDLISRAPNEEKRDVADCVATVMTTLGANLAESINERTFHVAKQVMGLRRTKMEAGRVEYRCVARMNSIWLDERKKIFKDLLQFLDLGENDMYHIIN